MESYLESTVDSRGLAFSSSKPKGKICEWFVVFKIEPLDGDVSGLAFRRQKRSSTPVT